MRISGSRAERRRGGGAHRLVRRSVGPSVTAVLVCLAGPGRLAGQDAGPRADLLRFFHQAVAEQGVVGAGMYLVGRDGVIDSAFAGFADREAGRRADGGTIWHWASITKTFTAIGVMQLRDRGLLSLDDPIVKYVPELRKVHSPHGPIEAVTIRHLLSHSGGFRSGTWPWGGDRPWHPFEPTSWEQLAAMLPYTEVMFPPGSQWQYSNPGIVFLGEAIRRLMGEDFEVYADKNLLDPLGMYASYFDVTPYHLRDRRANNYSVKDGQTTPNGLDFDTGITTSNGGLNAPLADMARYLRFLLEPGAGPHPLARASLEEMWRPVLPTGVNGPGRNLMGLGFFIIERPDGVRLIGHTGSQAGFRSFFYLHPESGLGIIASFNTAAAGEGANARPAYGPVFAGLADRFVALTRAAGRRSGGAESHHGAIGSPSPPLRPSA